MSRLYKKLENFFIVFIVIIFSIFIISLFTIPNQSTAIQTNNINKIASGKTIYCKGYNLSNVPSKNYIQVNKSLETLYLYDGIFDSKLGMYTIMDCLDTVEDNKEVSYIPILPKNVIKVTSLSTNKAPLFNALIDINGTLSNGCSIKGYSKGMASSNKIEYRVVEINCFNDNIKANSLATIGTEKNLVAVDTHDGTTYLSSVSGQLVYLEDEKKIGAAYIQSQNTEDLYILCHTKECLDFLERNRYNQEVNLKK